MPVGTSGLEGRREHGPRSRRGSVLLPLSQHVPAAPTRLCPLPVSHEWGLPRGPALERPPLCSHNSTSFPSRCPHSVIRDCWDHHVPSIPVLSFSPPRLPVRNSARLWEAPRHRRLRWPPSCCPHTLAALAPPSFQTKPPSTPYLSELCQHHLPVHQPAPFLHPETRCP